MNYLVNKYKGDIELYDRCNFPILPKKNNLLIYIFLFIIAIFLGEGGSINGLYKIPGGIDYFFEFTCIFIFCVFGFYLFVYKSKIQFLSQLYSVRLLGTVFICILIPTFLNGYFYYGQNLFTGVRECLHHAGLLLSIILVLFSNKISPQFISNFFLLLASYCAIVTIISRFYPDLSNVIWDKEAVFQLRDAGREDRIALPQAFRHAFYYAFYYFLAAFVLNKRKGNRDFTSLILLGGIFLIVLFVLMDRRRLFGMILLSIPVLVSMTKWTRGKIIVSSIFFFFTFLIFFSNGDFLSEQLGGLLDKTTDELNNQSGAAGIRIPCAEFYYDEFQKTGYIGIGAISTTRVTKNFSVIRALDSGYNHVDIGMLGVLTLWGFQGLFVTLALWYYSFRILRKERNNSNLSIRICAFAGVLFLIHELVTQSQFFWNIKNALFWGLFYSQVLLLELRFRRKKIIKKI